MKIGDQIDGAGVDMTMDDGDLVSGWMVIAMIVDDDGDESVRCAVSDGLGWMARRGMIETIRDSERNPTLIFDEQEDDE